MFDQTFVNTHAHTRRPWTVAASLTLQASLVGLVILLPMLHPEMLRMKPLEMPIFLPARSAPPPPPELQTAPRASAARERVFTGPPVLVQPGRIPPHATMLADPPEAGAAGLAVTGVIAVGSLGGLSGGIALPENPPAAAPVPVAKPASAGPVHVSSGVQAARLLFGPRPAYPPLAKAARVQGTVRIQAVIATDGAIRNLQVLSGPPLLVKAALEAVRQWRYQATLLSGNAVEVMTEIDVNFTLNQ